MLQGAMDYLHEQNGDSEVFQPVLSYTLNPKCVSMGELYGEYNTLTSEWKDGLASTLIRSAVTDATPVRKWVVFDGPVDAMWIENMNTVRMQQVTTYKLLAQDHTCCLPSSTVHSCLSELRKQSMVNACCHLRSPFLIVNPSPPQLSLLIEGQHRQQSSLTLKHHVQCVQSASTGAR